MNPPTLGGASRIHFLIPGWPAPAGVGAAMSLRWDDAVPATPAFDRGAYTEALRRQAGAPADLEPVFLRQVHGRDVARLGARPSSCADPAATPAVAPPTADASVTTQQGIACTVLVADCLPVLMCSRDGQAVAAAHAGWRGLAAGVLEAALDEVLAGARCEPQEVMCWLGPCIGPEAFEVGADVLDAFGAHIRGSAASLRFRPRTRADGSARWLADLRGLAADRLRARGVVSVWQDEGCTVTEPERFYSYRREGVTGRMAASVWRTQGAA